MSREAGSRVGIGEVRERDAKVVPRTDGNFDNVATMICLVPTHQAGDAGDDGEEFGGFHRFGDVHLEASHEGFAAVFGAGEGGQGDGGDGAAFGGGKGAEFFDEGVAVFAGHADVADDHFGAVLANAGVGVGGGAGGGDDRPAPGAAVAPRRARRAHHR